MGYTQCFVKIGHDKYHQPNQSKQRIHMLSDGGRWQGDMVQSLCKNTLAAPEAIKLSYRVI